MEDKEINEFVNEIFNKVDSKDRDKLMAEARTLYEKLSPAQRVYDLKEEDIMKVLKASYISERFFGKSRSWLCQKLNHSVKNGKPTEFTPDERRTLKEALDTIAYEIQILSDNIEI